MYFASLNKGKGSIEGLKNTQNAAEASTIGLTIAQTALNAAIGLGISVLISLVAKGINKLIHANEEAIESAKKLREEYENFKSTNANNISALKDLEDEFNELSKGVSQYGDNISLTTDQYERYKEIIQQIVGISPSLAEGYSTENGYIADKNGLLERAIELQEIEYRNELRKITNLENLKTSMSGYIAEYKEAFNGGLVTSDMSATVTKEFANLQSAIFDVFNTINRSDFDSQDMAREIMKSLGVEDVENELKKYFNEYGFQSHSFWNDYMDIIADNIEAITNSLTADMVGLDETVFDQNIEKLDSAAQSYIDMKDAISIANESIQKDLGYIAEYVDGYSDLSTEQKKFVSDFLKGFNITDIASENFFGFLKYDKDKMASLKSQITKFVESLSQDETTKDALADLYAIPTDEQSIEEFISQFRNALEIIQEYCDKNGIEIPLSISDSEQSINELEAQYHRAVDYAKDKFDGYDPTAFFNTNSVNTQQEIDKWFEIAQAANSATDAEERYIQSLTLNNNETPDLTTSISQLIDQLNTQLKPVFDSLKSAYQNIFTDDGFTPDSVDISMLESIKSNIEELNNLEDVDININMDAFDDFAKILTDVNVNTPEEHAQQAQQAFDDLATAIFNATGATEGMTDESVRLVEQLLESLGVVNATEVAVQALNESKVQAVMAAYDLIDATESEYIAMLNEAEAAGITRQEVYKLMAAEIAFGNNGLSVEQKIAQLKELANAYGDTATSALATAIMNEYASGHTDADTAINNVMGQINAGLQKVDIKFSGAIKSAGSGAKSAAGSAGKEAGKAYTDALEKELNELDTRMEAGYIDFNDYIQARLDLIEDYYRKGKISADEYYSHLEKHYEKQLSGYNKVLNAVTRRYDKEIDSINEIIDGIKKQNDALEKQLDEYDSALKVVDRVYEDQIKALKEQQDAIDDQINALKSANDERQRAIELDKAKYELERAQSQRTKLVYSDEKGMHYETDSDAIRSAREAVDNAQLEDVIAQLEKEKDAIDPLIEELENYREKWAEISNAYQDAIDKNIAESILGPDYKELILQNRIEDIEAFKDRYVAAQKQIDDNQGLIDSYNEKIEYYEALKQQWQDIADAYENSIEEQYAAMILGQNWEADVLSGRIDTLNAFKNEYAAIQQAIVDYAWYSANEQIKAAEAAKSAAGTPSSTPSSAPSISSGSNTTSLPSGTAGTVKKGSTGASIHIGGGSTANTQFVNRYASGTNNAKKGLNLVGEDGAEVYFDNHGHVAIVTAPTLIPMEGGEVVKNEKETKKLLNPDNLAPVVNDEMITLANGTALRPLQPGDKMYDYIQKFNAYVEKMGGDINAIAAPFGTIQKNTKQMANSLNTVNHISNNRTQGVNIGDINITCPGITSREVAKQVGVEVSNLFHGLHLTAMQESMKR